MNYGFDTGIVTDLSTVGGFGRGIRIRAAAAAVVSSTLFSNIDTYIINGVRELHSSTATAGSPGVLGLLTRSNSTRTMVLKVTSTVTVQGFKLIRTPEALGNWTTTTFDDFDVVLTVKSGGSINGGALASKTFATNTKVRSATRTAIVNPATVNSYRTEYDTYTVSDSSAVTLTAGTYTAVYRGTNTQIGVAALWESIVPIPTTTSIYPDPDDALNTYYPVMEILSSV